MSLSNRHQNTITVIRSLRIQRPNVLRDAPVISGENGASITCMHCSYVLHGQNTLNCPECGLWLASCYRDPTPWGETFNEKDADDPIAFGGFNAFWLTVFSIVRFDRRIRLRTTSGSG